MSEQTTSRFAEDLRRIHRVVTRSLGVAQSYAQEFAQAGFPDAAARVGYYHYVHSLSSLLESHHSGEDAIVFPMALERIPGAPIDHLCADHEAMSGILAEIDQALAQAESGASDAQVLAALTASLGKLGELWSNHIPLEEEVFSVRKLREAFKSYEDEDMTRRLTEHGMKNSGPDYLIMPFVLYNLSEEDRKVLASTIPPIVTQELVPVVWKDKWESMKPFLLV